MDHEGTRDTAPDARQLAADYEERQRWLAESAELTRRLLAGEPGDPLQLVVERVVAVAAAQSAFVLTQRADGRSYAVVAAAGAGAERLIGRTVAAEHTDAAEVIAAGVPRVVNNLSAREPRPELAEAIGVESAILVPLTTPGADQGMLAVVRGPDRPPFSAAAVEATTLFAGQMTLALQLAETRAHRERAALLDERDRIARDLHDHVIQRLFAIGLTLQALGSQFSGEPGTRLLDAVDDIDETIGQIRSSIYRLTAPLVESSVGRRVVALIDELVPVLGRRPELDMRGPVDLRVPDELTDDVVAVLREALTNVARHAGAKSVAVALSASPTDLVVEVVDDGRGIGATARRSGLANLRARAERRGGTLAVSRAEPCGTVLRWSVPLGDSPGGRAPGRG
jgi:signal transduction histidine kinase